MSERAIDHNFEEDLVITLPKGATEALFTGTLTLPPKLPGGIKPLIKTALGAIEGERVDAGLWKITRDGRFGMEWAPDKTKPAGSGKATSGEVTYQWTPNRVRIKIGNAAFRTFATNTGEAPGGGVVVFGVDPPKPDSDRPAEYVRLLGGRLKGTLKITGGVAQPGTGEPLPPPATGDLLDMVKKVRAKARDLDNAAAELLAKVESR